MSSSSTLSCQKHLFSLPDDLRYLNCAYMSPMSKAVEAAGVAAMRGKRVPTTVAPRDFFTECDRVRQLFAELVGAPDPRRVALIPAVSYGLATVARNTEVTSEHNIILLHEQFPSNVYAWRRLREDKGVELRTIEPPEQALGRGRTWSQRILEAIDSRTAIVALPHVHWADGTRFDLEQIARRAREVGAAVVVDGTQSVGALPFDIGEIQPDAVICAGYKWLLGPYSMGTAYFGPRYDGGIPLEENWIARRNSEDFTGLVSYQDEYQPGAIRYDVGERSNFILVPMLAAGLAHLRDWGVANIQAYCAALTREVLAEARELGFHIEDPAWRSAHLFGVRAPPKSSSERTMATLRNALSERNIAVSIRGSAVRIAPHVYNDSSDMEALGDAFRSSASK